MIDEALTRVDEFISREIERNGPPGLALAVTDAERTLAVRTYGYADLSARLRVRPEHLFQTGSTGKSFAAFMVMQEVEAGHLDLSAPVSEYLPWLQIPSAFRPITLHDLMTHTSGISTGGETSPGAEGEVLLLTRTEPAWEPGTRFWYSNAGWKAVGLVLAQVAGQPYAEVLRRRIFEPLGMGASEPAIVNSIRPRTAVGYKHLYDDRPEQRSHPWVPAPWSESTSADGSMLSTAEDMAAYLRLILNRGRGPNGPIVSEESFERMARPFTADPDTPGDVYGFGLCNRTKDARRFLGHSGGTLGYTTGMWTEDGLGLIVLQNSELGAWWACPYVLEVVRAALDGRELPSVPAEEDPSILDNAADYAGSYSLGDRTLAIEREGSRLMLEDIALERVEGDVFQTPHSAYDTFYLSFVREDGVVAEATYGPEVFARRPRTDLAGEPGYPREWDAFAGHFRSHNPWLSSIRVFVRQGTLVLAMSNVDLGQSELMLTPVAGAEFVLEDLPEQISFDTPIGERAHRAVLMGEEYWRTFTP